VIGRPRDSQNSEGGYGDDGNDHITSGNPGHVGRIGTIVLQPENCEDLHVTEAPFRIRPARDEDRLPMAEVFAAVADERDGIGTEPPVDVEARAESWTLEGTFVAVAGAELLGSIHIERSNHGYGELGMAITREWRGRGVGSALMVAVIEWAREQELHKLSLGVWPHNAAGIALYRKFGFVEEGRRVKQMRRQSGELWDVVDMGLLL
jgi:RimJ/RimL family protein N-acetyltransferase